MRMSLVRFVTVCVFTAAGFAADNAHGQDFSSSAPSDEAALELDFRMGGLWPEPSFGSRPSLGGRAALYLWSGDRMERLSLQFTGDYRSLGHRQTPDYPGVADPVRLKRTAMALGASLGFDVVRTPQWTIDVRGGVMMLRHRMSVQVNTRPGSSLADEVWEPVCHFAGFSDDCRTDYDAAGTLAIGARRYFGGFGDYFIGVDYTRALNSHNLLVGSFGVRLR